MTYLGTYSGNFTAPGTSAEVSLQLVLNYTQDIAGNYTDVSWVFQMVEFVNANPFRNYHDCPASATVEGQVFGANNLDYNFDQTNETIGIASGTRRIYHNADGTKTGVSVSASYDGKSPLGTASFSTTFDLPTIPRASTPTYSNNSPDAGASITITTNRADASFTHDIERRWQGETGAYTSIATGVGASTGWTVPSTLINDIPNATSRVLEIRTTTKQSGTTIGTSLTYITVGVPSSVVPDFGTVTHAEAVTSPNIASLIGAYVQGNSKLTLAITSAVAGTGASIVQKYVQVLSGATILQVVDVLAGSAVTPAVLSASGTITLRGYVVDSRGRSYYEDVAITVLAYAAPSVTSLGIQRSLSDGTVDENGTYIRVNLNAAVQSLLVSAVQKNALTYRISTSPRDANTWTVKATTSPGGITFNSHAEVGTYVVTSAFDVKIEVYDKLSGGAPWTTIATISTAGVFLHLGNSGQGIGIGKYWESGRGSLDALSTLYQNNGERVWSDGAAVSVAGTNLNNLKKTGWYRGDSLTNGPTAAASGNWYFVEVIRHDDSYVLQRATPYFASLPGDVVYVRECNGGTWGAWQLVSNTRLAALEAKLALHRMFSVGPTTYNPLPTSNVTIGSDIVIPAEATYDRMVHAIAHANVQINGANEAWLGIADGSNTQLAEAHGIGANAINNTRWSLVVVKHVYVPAGSGSSARTFRMRGRANNSPVAVAEDARLSVTVQPWTSGDT